MVGSLTPVPTLACGRSQSLSFNEAPQAPGREVLEGIVVIVPHVAREEHAVGKLAAVFARERQAYCARRHRCWSPVTGVNRSVLVLDEAGEEVLLPARPRLAYRSA